MVLLPEGCLVGGAELHPEGEAPATPGYSEYAGADGAESELGSLGEGDGLVAEEDLLVDGDGFVAAEDPHGRP